MNKRDFKSLIDINTQEFLKIIQRAIDFKELDKLNKIPMACLNKTLAMIFKKTKRGPIEK